MKSRKTIKFCTPAQSIILDVFLSRKYIQIDPTEEEEVSDDSDVDSEEEEEDTEEEEKLGPMSWDIMWTRTKWVKNNILGDNGHPLRLRKEQRVNHFPNSYQLTRKDLMFGNLERYAWKLKKVKKSDVLDFSPKTYFLPQLWALWRAEFRDSNDIWIAKPIAGSQGIGIKFIRDLEEAIDFREKSYDKYLNAKSTKEQLKNTYVVQKYISNPYLIDGRKFDIRFYVLTLSYKPLVVYVFREGFCRFSTQKYNLRNLDADIHLTNVAVQVQSAQYDAKNGNKMDISELRSYFLKKVGMIKTQKLFDDIQMIFLNSLQAATEDIISDPHCFELYGYDILIDSNLKPWLIEINATPSMEATTEHDYDLKFELLSNTIDLVLMTREMSYDKLPTTYGGFDLVWKKNAIIFDSKTVAPSKLGNNFVVRKSDQNPERIKMLNK